MKGHPTLQQYRRETNTHTYTCTRTGANISMIKGSRVGTTKLSIISLAICFIMTTSSNFTPVVSAAFTSVERKGWTKSTSIDHKQSTSSFRNHHHQHHQSLIIPKSCCNNLHNNNNPFSSSSALALSPRNVIQYRVEKAVERRSGIFPNSYRNSKDNKFGRSKSAIHKVSSTMPHADIAVRLDQPLLSTSSSRVGGNASILLKSILTILVSDVAKTACIAFVLAFIIKFLSKSSTQTVSKLSPIISSANHVFKLVQGQIKKFRDEMMTKQKEGIPMVFEEDPNGSAGWGVCTLSSKKQVGRSNFLKYDFKLPKADNILNLALGQKVTLCCLNNDDQVAKKDYYLFSPKNNKGGFSILAPMDGVAEDDGIKLAKGEGDFAKVLAEELTNGDEVALQPGPRTLTYRGEYLPVTDMLYVASGSGIAPVLDQVKAVLPSGSSSVKSVTVLWINDNEEDFDIALSSLEDEYFKYSTKLAVSCVVNEDNEVMLDENKEVEEALTPFKPGTMAVIAGPKSFSNEARSMLMGYGYPEECICVLP